MLDFLRKLDALINYALLAIIDPHFKLLKFLDEEQIEDIKVELVRRIEAVQMSEECQVSIVKKHMLEKQNSNSDEEEESANSSRMSFRRKVCST